MAKKKGTKKLRKAKGIKKIKPLRRDEAKIGI